MNLLYRRRRWASDWSTFRVHVPPGGKQSPEMLQRLLLQLWARVRRGSWFRLLHGQPWLVFEIWASSGQIEHLWSVNRSLEPFLEAELTQAYRPGTAERCDHTPDDTAYTAGVTLRLSRPACFGLADRGPIGSDLIAALSGVKPSERVTLQLLMIPLSDREWRPDAHAAFRRAAQLEADGSAVTSMAIRWAEELMEPVDEFLGLGRKVKATARRDTADAVERAMIKEAPGKLRDHAFEVMIRLVATALIPGRAHSLVQAVSAQFASLDDANQVIPRRSWAPSRLARQVQRRWPTHGDVWTCGELAALIGVPGPQQDRLGSRIIELPTAPPVGDITIGYGVYRGQRVPVQVTVKDLSQHMAIMGKTGAGKGVLQLNWAVELAKAGRGFTWLFPLRQDAYRLMAALPEDRLNDVIFFEVGHPKWALPLNLLAHDGTEEDQARVERDSMNLAWRLWSDSWGKSMERFLRAAVIGAAAVRGHIGTAERILTDEDTRLKAAARVQNDSVRRFLQTWEAPAAAVDPAINKLQELLWQRPIADMVGQPDALPWRSIISDRRIVIGSLNQEQMGDLAANLAAGGVVAQIQRTAMSIPPGQRVFHALGLDEFRTVAGRARDNWEVGFSQLRQFEVGLIPAGQYPAQLPESVWRAMTGNVGSKVVLREEAEHARACLELLGPGVTAEDLQALPSLQGYASLLMDGKPIGPFTLYAPPYVEPRRDGYVAAEASMARWLRPRQNHKQMPRAPQVLEVE